LPSDEVAIKKVEPSVFRNSDISFILFKSIEFLLKDRWVGDLHILKDEMSSTLELLLLVKVVGSSEVRQKGDGTSCFV